MQIKGKGQRPTQNLRGSLNNGDFSNLSGAIIEEFEQSHDNQDTIRVNNKSRINRVKFQHKRNNLTYDNDLLKGHINSHQ